MLATMLSSQDSAAIGYRFIQVKNSTQMFMTGSWDVASILIILNKNCVLGGLRWWVVIVLMFKY